MAPVERLGSIAVEVVYSPAAAQVEQLALTVPLGTTLRQAIGFSRVLQRHPGIDIETQRVGVWGKLRGLDEPLRDRDRIEIYRPLQVDPKEARRLRYRQHRERFGR